MAHVLLRSHVIIGVGLMVGAKVGDVVGDTAGEKVGDVVGDALGEGVGATVFGQDVGDNVGSGVGFLCLALTASTSFLRSAASVQESPFPVAHFPFGQG